MHEAKSLSGDLEREKIDSGYVAAGFREVRNEAEGNWIVTNTEYNRDRCGCSFGRERRGGAAGVAITATRRRIKLSSKSGSSAY